MTPEELMDDYDWREAFAYGVDPRRCEGDTKVSVDPVKIDDVVSVVAYDNGENDGASWIGVFALRDGRYAYLDAWCDYTGWDCRAGGETIVSTDLALLHRFALTDESRRRLAPRSEAASD